MTLVISLNTLYPPNTVHPYSQLLQDRIKGTRVTRLLKLSLSLRITYQPVTSHLQVARPYSSPSPSHLKLTFAYFSMFSRRVALHGACMCGQEAAFLFDVTAAS